MRIGPFELPNNLFVAPMAGVTDRPFRTLCKRLGAGYAVSEMVTSRRDLWKSLKTSRRADHAGEGAPIAVQIAGVDPAEMADAARYNIDRGAQIIDINMGCPAKKVCNVSAGSALMSNEPLALRIIESVVQACSASGTPVTLKMRTGRRAEERNAVQLALAAEEAGIAMVTVHGRTREQQFTGQAEYDTIAAVKAQLRIPVVANGDIDSPQKALDVLRLTGADAVMIGRAAQGRPWIFADIAHRMKTGADAPAPSTRDVRQWLSDHLLDHYGLYGEAVGVRTARKHIGWAVKAVPGGETFRAMMNTLESAAAQWQAVQTFFDELADVHPRWPAANDDRLLEPQPMIPLTRMTRQLIEDSVRSTLERYFQDLGDSAPHDMHALMISTVEKPLLEVVMQKTQGNQSKAAEWLGINRNTLRRKLLDHHLLE